MKQVEAIFGIPVEMQQYAKSQGVVGVFTENNRVYVVPLLKWFTPILSRLFAGGQLRDGETEYLDPDAELAALRREQKIAAARENALADGEIHTRANLEELLWENGLGQMRSDIHAMLKKYRQQTTASVAEQIVRDDLPKLISTIRSMLPTQNTEVRRDAV